MAIHQSYVAISLILLSGLVATCYGVPFTSLNKTIAITATPSIPSGQVLKGGESTLTISWSLNATSSVGIDTSDYRTVEIKLCYAPISQKDRGWRRTEEELQKDKTCQHKIVERPYNPSNNMYTATIKKDVPSATYFVRLYVHNSHKEVVAFGDTTDAMKTTNLFEVVAVTGRSIGLDIASVCFSAFSIISLFGFFILEKRRAKTK
ncbi:hypothetical protein ACJIZ3_005536 [Penstemon smallii]|uniref:High-affinity nitrate transporter n=1 Tax=Penstemon smallii TaxID=265156 RepID=A0ABD3S584_9LAMI